MGAGGFWLKSRPFGALRGLVRLTSSKPAIGLTWWLSATQPPGWEDKIGAFDFCTVKVSDGRKALGDKQIARVAEACRAAGTPLQSWSYNYATTNEKAHAEGILAAQEAIRVGARAHWINCEHQWAGGYMGQTGADNPAETMQTLVNAFRVTAPHIRVIFNSTTSWMSPRLTPEIDRQIAALFDAYGPMVYSSGSTGGAKTMRKKWARGYAIAQEVGIPYCPMVGSGRQDKKGQYWTNFEALAQVTEEMPADWIAFWIAPGQADRIYTANALNPSLADFAGVV
jgi:hypothetical protein